MVRVVVLPSVFVVITCMIVRPALNHVNWMNEYTAQKLTHLLLSLFDH